MADCKGKLPRFPRREGFVPSRGRFLRGEDRICFGPGQRPNMHALGYRNPSEMPRESTLLRCPQVVWLQADLHPAATANGATLTNAWWACIPWVEGNAIFHRDHIDPDTGPFWMLDRSDPYPRPREQMQANLARVETDRLIAAFAEAKARVEAVRPGVTWVEVVDYHDGGDVEFDSIGDYEHAGYAFLEVPPGDPSSPDFLGSNFFNIWCGHPYRGRLWDSHLPFGYAAGDVADDDSFATPYADIATLCGAGAFGGYSARLYHPDLTWDHWHGWDRTDSTLEIAIVGRWSAVVGDAAVEGIGGGWTDDSTSAFCGVATPTLYDDISAIAARDDLDIAHPGPTSLVTADYLVRLIAGHYGFDPETGADLR